MASTLSRPHSGPSAAINGSQPNKPWARSRNRRGHCVGKPSKPAGCLEATPNPGVTGSIRVTSGPPVVQVRAVRGPDLWVPKLIVRRPARQLHAWCGLVEANPVGSRVDELHLPAIAGAWLDAWIEERIPALMQLGVQRVEVAPRRAPPSLVFRRRDVRTGGAASRRERLANTPAGRRRRPAGPASIRGSRHRSGSSPLRHTSAGLATTERTCMSPGAGAGGLGMARAYNPPPSLSRLI